METIAKLKSIPSDITLMTIASLGDCERIASTASIEDIQTAIAWCADRLSTNHTRHVILCQALKKKGGAP